MVILAGMTTSSHSGPGHAARQSGESGGQAGRTPWQQALDAKRTCSGKVWPGGCPVGAVTGGNGKGKGRGKGFMPFKATGHKGGISRQG